MLGPLGIRLNQWYHVNNRFEFRSPFRHGFTWDNRVVWAHCDQRHCPPLGKTDAFFSDYPEIIDIGEDCWCGIYVTSDIAVAHSYAQNWDTASFVLVEGLGTVILHTEGFRASGVQIVKVVDPSCYYDHLQTEKYRMTMLATARQFGVGIIDWMTASKMIDYQLKQWLETSDESEEQNESN